MLKLEFKINKYYLLVHALRQFDLPFPEWEDLKNRLWKKFPAAFYLVSQRPEAAFAGEKPLEEFNKTCREAERLVKAALRSEEFKKIHRETESYLRSLQEQWEKNKSESLGILEDLAGFKLPDRTIAVFVTHPKLRNGFAMPHRGAIGWGHSEDWPNYSTVYLCHEIIHLLTINKSRDDKIMHVIIQLMTDDELRIRLNKEGKYFTGQEPSGKMPAYFQELHDLEKKALPYWEDYLKNRRERDIFDLENKLIEEMKKR